MGMRTTDLVKFITARENVRIAKEEGFPKPWTKDEILQTYRFCNVHREDDAVTKWIAQNWRTPYAEAVDLWFAMVVARLFNNPDTLADITPFVFAKGSVRWQSERARRALHGRAAGGKTVFNAAYIVSTNGIKMNKIDYVIDIILDALWEARKLYRPQKGDALEAYHERLTKARGLGSFMAAQVVADLKYVAPLGQAADWSTFASSGPGSRRGLNRVFGCPTKQNWGEKDWRARLQELQAAVNGRLKEPLHAQDLQNCLCEFDKYERIRTGEGRPKQLYPGAE